VLERLWWNRIRQPDTIRSLLQLVYARPAAIDESLLQRIVAATERPDALDAFTSILLSPRTELDFNQMLAALRCPVCLAYGACMCVAVRACMRACVCVWRCVRACAHVCVCVCAWVVGAGPGGGRSAALA
jgi:hypothetical protein